MAAGRRELPLAANRGAPIGTNREEIIAEDDGLAVLDVLHTLASLVPAWCRQANPTGVCEALATTDDYCYAPLIFGYINYSLPDFRRHRLRFIDLPAGLADIEGSCLAGAGIAIPAASQHASAAADFAYWVASATCQTGLYFDSGGQPANAVAWEGSRLNAACWDFFRGTRATLEKAWTRPRLRQWLNVHHAIGTNVAAALAGEISDTDALRHMTRAYHDALEAEGA